MQNFRFLRLASVACLAFLLALMVKQIYPQAALGRVIPFADVSASTYSFAPEALMTSAKSDSGEMLIASATKQDALAEAQKQFVCVASSEQFSDKKFANFNQSYIESQIVRKLAEDQKLKQCINQNRRKIEFVSLEKLYRVIYMTRRLQDTDKVIVIVGVGSTQQVPQRAQFSEAIIDFVTKQSNQNDFSVALDGTTTGSRSFPVPLLKYEKTLDEIDLGTFTIEANGNMNFPNKLRLSGNEASIDASLKIAHQVIPTQVPFQFFSLNFQGKSSDFNKDFLSGKKTELARAELTFNGLFLKGIPYYLDNRKKNLEKDLGVKVGKIDERDDSKGSLTKTVALSNLNAFEELKAIENSLLIQQQRVQKIQAKVKHNSSNSQLQRELETAENELKNVLADKVKRLEPLNRLEFQCAPNFKRIIEFPIWGKTTSTGSGSTGASAGVGVRGDVVIDIANPTCSFSIVPPYSSTSTTYADVSILSHGYFGARAQAQASGDVGIKFKDQYDKVKGEYVLDLKKLSNLNEQEKDYTRAILEKTLEKAKKDQKTISQIQNSINRDFVQPLLSSEGLRRKLSSIESGLIQKYARDRKVLCSEIEKRLGKTVKGRLGETAELVCWATLPQPKAIEIAQSFGVGGYTPMPPSPSAIFKETICSEDPTTQVVTGILSGGASRVASLTPQQKKFCSWVSDKNKWFNQVEQAYKRFANPDSNILRAIAEKFVKEIIQLPANILNDKDFELMARRLLELAFEVNQGIRDVDSVVQILSNPLQSDLLKGLNLTIKASANVEFDSKANILTTRPMFQLESTLLFPDGKPALHLKGSSYENGPGGSKGQIGGLEPLNLLLKAKLFASLGDEQIPVLPEGRLPLIQSPSIDIGTPKLSNTKKLLYDQTISLSSTGG